MGIFMANFGYFFSIKSKTIIKLSDLMINNVATLVFIAFMQIIKMLAEAVKFVVGGLVSMCVNQF